MSATAKQQPVEKATSPTTSPAKGSNGGAAEPPDASRGPSAAAEEIRKRAELGAKSLGGLGTTVVSAIGLAKFSDVWPYPPESPIAVAAVILGFLAMAGAVAAFAYRLWSVNEPIIWRSDPDQISKLRAGELELVKPLYDEMAKLNDVESMRAYEARSMRLQRIAPRLPAQLRDAVLKQAASIAAGISATHARANLRVVRARANAALKGRWAIFFYTLFIGGVLGFGLGADYLQSERADRVALAKSCAEATDAGATDLPRICGTPEPKPSLTPNPREEVTKAVENLGSALHACELAAEKVGGPHDECDPIREAIKSALNEL